MLDIRNNGGGLFPAGVDVARMLLDDGDIVLIADSQGVRDSYQANSTAVEPSAPLAVLVNRGTASASEVRTLLSHSLQPEQGPCTRLRASGATELARNGILRNLTVCHAQVLAGALKDNGRGKVVGETTFGKGLIQTIVELSDGSGVAVTVARYQTPDGTDINKTGIQPDIAMDMGE